MRRIAVMIVCGLLTTGWVIAGGGSEAFVRGDSNSDSSVDIADAIFTLEFLFGSGTAPSCADAADANDDGGVDISDAIVTLDYLFSPTVTMLPAPFPAEGLDVFRNFLVSLAAPPGARVSAVQLRPGNRRLVHHAAVLADTSGAARRLDALEPLP